MNREMTSEEKLQFAAEMMNAISKNGLKGAKITYDIWALRMSNEEDIEQRLLEKNDPEMLKRHEKAMKEERIPADIRSSLDEEYDTIVSPPKSTILTEEHQSMIKSGNIEAVEEDIREHGLAISQTNTDTQVKTKVLEQSRPNPWGDAKVVSPGEVKEILTR